MASSEFTRPPFDALAAQRWQKLLATNARKGNVPWLHEEVGQRMAGRLEWIKSRPAQWVNWRASASGNSVHQAVALRYPESKVFMAPTGYESVQSAMDLVASKGWLSKWMGGLRGVGQQIVKPIEPEQAQLLWSNMSLHSEPDPADCIRQWHRLLAVDGMLMFSCLGPDTAIELQQIHRAEGWGPPAHPLTDMHDWGDLLVSSGFSQPVMDMERIVLSFTTPQRALEELRGLGRNLHPDRFVGLRGKYWLESLCATLEKRRSDDGKILLTFEVIYGHAVKLAPRVAVSSESAISLTDMRSMLRNKR